jgi:hypothetical protein
MIAIYLVIGPLAAVGLRLRRRRDRWGAAGPVPLASAERARS